MEKIEFGLKLYLLGFVMLLLISVALNLSAKKEYRKTLWELGKEVIQIWVSMSVIFLVGLGLAWFLFDVI